MTNRLKKELEKERDVKLTDGKPLSSDPSIIITQFKEFAEHHKKQGKKFLESFHDLSPAPLNFVQLFQNILDESNAVGLGILGKHSSNIDLQKAFQKINKDLQDFFLNIEKEINNQIYPTLQMIEDDLRDLNLCHGEVLSSRVQAIKSQCLALQSYFKKITLEPELFADLKRKYQSILGKIREYDSMIMIEKNPEKFSEPKRTDDSLNHLTKVFFEEFSALTSIQEKFIAFFREKGTKIPDDFPTLSDEMFYKKRNLRETFSKIEKELKERKYSNNNTENEFAKRQCKTMMGIVQSNHLRIDKHLTKYFLKKILPNYSRFSQSLGEAKGVPTGSLLSDCALIQRLYKYFPLLCKNITDPQVSKDDLPNMIQKLIFFQRPDFFEVTHSSPPAGAMSGEPYAINPNRFSYKNSSSISSSASSLSSTMPPTAEKINLVPKKPC